MPETYVADTSRLQQMILNAGRDQAEAEYNRGSGWSDFFQSIGPTLGAAMAMHARDKQMKAENSRMAAQQRAQDALAESRLEEIASAREEGARRTAQETAWADFIGSEDFQGMGSRPAAVRKALSIFGDPKRAAEAVTGALGAEAKVPEGFSLSPGQVRYDAQGNVLATAPALPREERPPTTEFGVRLDAYARSKGKKVGDLTFAEVNEATRTPDKPSKPDLERVETVDAQGRPVTQFVTPVAGQSFAKPTGQGKPATGQQRKALTFFNRAKEAQQTTTELEDAEQLSAARLAYTPDWANLLQSQPNQAYKQAQRAFTEARLRKESGAAVPQHEYDNDAKTYFVQPGDSAETIKQKQRGRNAVLAGIAFESGDALREFYGDEAEGLLAGLKESGKSKPAGKSFDESDPYGYLPGDVIDGPNGAVLLWNGKRWVKP